MLVEQLLILGPHLCGLFALFPCNPYDNSPQCELLLPGQVLIGCLRALMWLNRKLNQILSNQKTHYVKTEP